MYSTADSDNPGSDERLTQTGEGRETDLAQRGEIEVTEEMIAAGYDVLRGQYDPDDFKHEEVVREVYIAMEKSRLSEYVGRRTGSGR